MEGTKEQKSVLIERYREKELLRNSTHKNHTKNIMQSFSRDYRNGCQGGEEEGPNAGKTISLRVKKMVK